MNFNKIRNLTLGIIFCSVSLGEASERYTYSRGEARYARKMHQQNGCRQTKQNDFLHSHFNKEFIFIPRFKSETGRGQALLGLLILSTVAQTISADNEPAAQTFRPSSAPYDCLVSPQSHECTLYKASSILDHAGIKSAPALAAATTSGLTELFCLQKSQCVRVKDNQVIFTGPKEVVDNIEKKLGDFSEIRKTLIPPSPEAGKTQANPKDQFDNPTELLKSLGVSPEDLENMAVTDYNNCKECADMLGLNYEHIKDLPICELSGINNNIIAINYKGSENGGISFNQRTADSFLSFLKHESLFFKFLTDTNKKIITYTDKYIFMNYGIFNDYFSLVKPIKNYQDGHYTLTLPLETVLKRLMAAVSGGISLEQTSLPGTFHVRTVTLKNNDDMSVRQAIPPVIKIILDASGSMNGKPIDTINRNIPSLLSRFQTKLEREDSLNIKIYTLNTQFSLWQTFLLQKDIPFPQWHPLMANGGTDLTPFGRLLKIEEGESSSQILVGITDGEHTGPSQLDADYYSELKALQASGHFAQPFLCRVGKGSDKFFVNMNLMFSGSYLRENTIEACLERVHQAIPDILVSKMPLVLTINGNNKVIWQNNAHSGIQSTLETVQEGSAIVLGHYKATVKVETKEEKKARLKAELEALENEI